MLTTYKEVETQLLLLAEAILEHRYGTSGMKVEAPEQAETILQNNIGCRDYADYSIIALMLSPMRRILEIIEIEAPYADPVTKLPAEVARAAIVHGASSVIVGVVASIMRPDESHRDLCCRIAVALDLVGVTFSDFILSDETASYSFSAHKEHALPRRGDDDGEGDCRQKAA